MSKIQHMAMSMAPTGDCALAYLVLTNGIPEEWCGVIDEQRKVIGRSRECDITVPSRFAHVSRRHAEIYYDRQELKIRDLASRSGTHINGVWIEEHQEATLVPGDRIWMGGAEFSLVSKIPTRQAVGADEDISSNDCMLGATAPLPAQLLLAELTQAELAVVMWMSRGYFKDEEIAQKLFRSPHTVRTQINSIFRKLNIRSRADIIGLLKGCE